MTVPMMRLPSSFSEFVDAIGFLISIQDLDDGSFGQSRFRSFSLREKKGDGKNEKCGGNVMDPFSFSPTTSPLLRPRPPRRGSQGLFPSTVFCVVNPPSVEEGTEKGLGEKVS